MRLKDTINKFKKMPKLAMTSFLVGALTLPLLTPLVNAQEQVTWEGATTSLNVTKGQTRLQDVTDADPGDVVHVQLWQHNRENPAGPRAINTRVNFTIPNQVSTNHVITGTSRADNAPTISDPTTVRTTPDLTKIEYIPGSAKFHYNKGAADGDQSCETGFNFPPARCMATVSISDEVVRGGVNLDTIRGGSLRGCNAHHELVIIRVRLVEKQQPPASTGVCSLLDLTVLNKDEREVRATVNGSVNNAQITGYRIDFGDNTVVEEQSATHKYSADGTYTIRGFVTIRFADGSSETKTAEACTKKITFEQEQPPVITPTSSAPATPSTLPATGPADTAAIFTIVTIAGSLGYRVFMRRFAEDV
jgi:hypothetical protein